MLARARRLLLALVALAGLALPAVADAQRCVKGKPCGDSCIARSKTCRVGPGSATWGEGADTAAATEIASPATYATPSRVVGSPAGRATFRAEGPRASCVITRVVDGDTVWCTGGRKVRLLLIDAPERSQGPYGGRASAALRALLPEGTEATLEFDVERQDRYRRSLAYVYLPDGRMANEELVRAGYAVVSVYPPNVRHVERMREAAEAARRARRGLWETSAFECLPSDHRRGRC